MNRADLTEPQRRIIDRAAADDEGFAMCWTRADGRVSRNLEAMALGDASTYGPTYFRINEAGLLLADHSPIRRPRSC